MEQICSLYTVTLEIHLKTDSEIEERSYKSAKKHPLVQRTDGIRVKVEIYSKKKKKK